MRHGAEQLLRKIKGVVRPLFETQERVRFQICRGHRGLCSEGMSGTEKDMGRSVRQRMEFQTVFLQHRPKYFLVETAQIQNPDFAVHAAHVLHDLVGACLPQREPVRLRREPANQPDKSIHRKGIVLGGDGTALAELPWCAVVLVQQVRLLHHLSGIGEKLPALLRQCNAPSRAVEDRDAEFFLQCPHRT